MRNPVCWLIRQRLDAFQDGELGHVARAKAEGHLAGCAGCAAELAALGRLRAVLTGLDVEPAHPRWDAFWPQVRARIARADDAESRDRLTSVPSGPGVRPWGPWRLAFGSAIAAGLAMLLVFAPWGRAPDAPVSGRRVARTAPLVERAEPGAPIRAVVVESVETADPQSSVMVFTPPSGDVTVVWVFGLEPTGSDI